MQIELLYAITIGIAFAVLIGTWYGKLTIPMAIIIFLTVGLGLAWLLAPYTTLIMTPLANSIWYGYAWGWLELMALLHVITSMAWVLPIMVYNLYKTEGLTGWT